MKEVEKTLPEYSYIYLGDNARTPYGCRSQEIIYEYTCEGISELFSRGVELVILACNTASAAALRKIQQEYLPAHYPEKKVLGIIIPTAQALLDSKVGRVGIFATEATVEAGSFVNEIDKINKHVEVFQQACPSLVPIIETGESKMFDSVVGGYVKDLLQKCNRIDTVILGCTHYAIIKDAFSFHLPERIRIISQGEIVARSLVDYLQRHPEIAGKLNNDGYRAFLTTGNSSRVRFLAQLFYGKDVEIETIDLRKIEQ